MKMFQRKAESNIKPGDTPLHVACRIGEANIIDSLISLHHKATELKKIINQNYRFIFAAVRLESLLKSSVIHVKGTVNCKN